MPEKLQKPRGTRDFLPDEMAMRRKTQAALDVCAGRFGYGEIMTPAFEHTDLFLRKSGEEIAEQVYTFEDKGGRSLTLRPELTAATIRLVSEGMRDVAQPLRLFYFENCFRYERPQKGRYREFWQWGAELIGPDTSVGDAEMVHLADSVLRDAGLQNFKLRVGHVGVLKSVIAWCGLGVDEGGSGAVGEGGRAGGIMSLIDKGDMAGLEDAITASGLDTGDIKAQTLMAVVEGKGAAGDVLGRVGPMLTGVPGAAEGLERLKEVADLLDSFGVKDFDVDLAIARGLDYYTGVVFEVDVDALGAEKQVLGGGRYELSHLFDMRPTPMTGFALGFDRLLLALDMEGKTAGVAGPDIYVVPFGKDDVPAAQELVARLRNGGFRAEGDAMGRNMKKTLAHAASRDPRLIIFCGGDEGGRGAVVVKDAATREQKEVPLEGLEGELRKALTD